MGAHSTIYVTESKAKEMLLNHILSASRHEVEKLMDAILYDRLYNCVVVDDSEENDNELL